MNQQITKVFRIIGFLLIAVGLIILLIIFGPLIREEIRYRIFSLQTDEVSVADADVIELHPVDNQFGLVIPRIFVNTKVFEKVSDRDPRQYQPVLAQGVAQADWSGFPGEGKVIFIFAHSAESPLNIRRYNAEFYLLGKLRNNDRAIVYYRSQPFVYRIIKRVVVSPLEVESVVKDLEGEYLVLQTCHPPGTTINRLLVIGTPLLPLDK